MSKEKEKHWILDEFRIIRKAVEYHLFSFVLGSFLVVMFIDGIGFSAWEYVYKVTPFALVIRYIFARIRGIYT